jgi:hypothetical protein
LEDKSRVSFLSKKIVAFNSTIFTLGKGLLYLTPYLPC